MTDLTSIVPLQTRMDRLWAAYTESRETAERTKRIEDGMAAGRAWAAWLDEFMTDEMREYLHRLPRRRAEAGA